MNLYEYMSEMVFKQSSKGHSMMQPLDNNVLNYYFLGKLLNLCLVAFFNPLFLQPITNSHWNSSKYHDRGRR